MDQPDITKLPVITCWPKDGGPFVTLPIIHTKDPNTGSRNVGMYRMQVFGPRLTGMHWHKHKVSAKHFNEYKKLGKTFFGNIPVYDGRGLLDRNLVNKNKILTIGQGDIKIT